MRNIFATTGIAIGAVLAALAVGPAQAEFPEKPVTIVVPWQAGSSPDVAMRTLASLASDDLGQPIVVQNIVGGSGSVGTLAVKNAAADGYTLLHNWVAPHVVARLFNPEIGYNDDDFAPLFGLIALPFTLAVRSDHPATDVASFVEWANAQDRPVNVGICAALSVPRMVMEEFLRASGVESYKPVPFNGCMPDNVKALLDGSLDATTGVLIAEKIFGGAIKSLAVLTDDRIPFADHIPTAKEQGVDIGWGKTSQGWAGLVAPAGTPAAVLDKLRSVLGKHVRTPAFLDKMTAQFIPIEYSEPEDFRALWNRSAALLEPAVQRLLKEKKN